MSPWAINLDDRVKRSVQICSSYFITMRRNNVLQNNARMMLRDVTCNVARTLRKMLHNLPKKSKKMCFCMVFVDIMYYCYTVSADRPKFSVRTAVEDSSSSMGHEVCVSVSICAFT